MLASKIEVFSIYGSSKRPSKIHLFSHRFFIDLGSVLASNMYPFWEPRRLKSDTHAPQKFERYSQERFCIRLCYWTPFNNLLALIFCGSWLDFRKFFDEFSTFLAYFGHVFGCGLNFRHSWPGIQPTLSRESKNMARTKPRTNPYRFLQETSDHKVQFF